MTDDNKTEPQANEDEARRKTNMLKAGIGIGIGSAAIVAALLYSNNARKKKGEEKIRPQPPADTD